VKKAGKTIRGEISASLYMDYILKVEKYEINPVSLIDNRRNICSNVFSVI